MKKIIKLLVQIITLISSGLLILSVVNDYLEKKRYQMRAKAYLEEETGHKCKHLPKVYLDPKPLKENGTIIYLVVTAIGAFILFLMRDKKRR